MASGYDAVDPENRSIIAELEMRWNRALAHVGEIAGKIAANDAAMLRPLHALTTDIAALAMDLQTVRSAPTTDARFKKRIVGSVFRPRL